MDKEKILAHVEDLSAEDLAEYILQGIVTLEELMQTGDLDATKRLKIKRILEARKAEEDKFWGENKGSEIGCSDYLQKYPAGKHIKEAEQLRETHFWNRISQSLDGCRQYLREFPEGAFKSEAERKIRSISDTLEKLKANPNSETREGILNHLREGNLSRDALQEIGISGDVFDFINSNPTKPIIKDSDMGKTPNKIPDGFTEVYFWGMAGSGKTTALAAILGTAGKEGILHPAIGPGFKYMAILQNLFKPNSKYSLLPGPTPNKIQYLPFTLQTVNESNARSVSLIELSGEVFQFFLYQIADEGFTSESHETAFSSLERFLSSPNRKIHFFFIDYGRGNNPDSSGYTQAQYLNAAATYFNKKENKIFSDTTDAVYVVLTKSDLMSSDPKVRLKELKKYLKNENYSAFVNSLKINCRKFGINNGKVMGTPFSLGKVYFSDVCEFDESTSKNILDIFMKRIPKESTSILDVLNK